MKNIYFIIVLFILPFCLFANLKENLLTDYSLSIEKINKNELRFKEFTIDTSSNLETDSNPYKHEYRFINKASLYLGACGFLGLVLSGAAVSSSPMARESDEAITVLISSSLLTITSGIIYYFTMPKKLTL